MNDKELQALMDRYFAEQKIIEDSYFNNVIMYGGSSWVGEYHVNVPVTKDPNMDVEDVTD